MSKTTNAKDILDALRAQKAQKAQELAEKKANKKPSTKRICNKYTFSNLNGFELEQACSKLSNHGLNLLEAIINAKEFNSLKEWSIELEEVMKNQDFQSKMASHKIVAFYYPQLVKLGLVIKTTI